jgi:hypothetical protein
MRCSTESSHLHEQVAFGRGSAIESAGLVAITDAENMSAGLLKLALLAFAVEAGGSA